MGHWTDAANTTRRGLLSNHSPQQFLSTFLALIAVFVAVHWYRSYTRLRHFPGPRIAAWTKLPLLRWTVSGSAHLEYLRLAKTYGPIVRIAPNILMTSDPDLMRRIAAPRSPYRRSAWYMAFRFNPERDNLISTLDEDTHTELRGKMAQGYSGKEIVGLEEKIDTNVLNLLRLIESKYLSQPGDSKPFDLAQKSQYFTVDTIGDVSFNKVFGFLTEDRDLYDYLKTSAESFPFFIVLSMFPGLMKVMQLDAMKKYLPSAKDSFGMGRIMGFAQEVVGERFASKDDELHQDMLGSFVRHGLTREEAESESVLQILAGAETTATALRIVLFYVYTNPRILAALRVEIVKARPPSPIPDEEAKKMPYLQAVIKEGLRICPPITGLIPKDVPREGDTYRGNFIPGGTQVAYCAMAPQRDDMIWGHDVEVFRPERFLHGSEEELRERHAVVEHVFGYGRWRCLGRSIALIELNKTIVEVVRNFDLSVVDPTTPFKTWNAGIHVQSGMWMRASRVPAGAV